MLLKRGAGLALGEAVRFSKEEVRTGTQVYVVSGRDWSHGCAS